MKRGLLCVAAAVVLLVFGAWGLVSLRNYPAENVVEKDHVRFYLRRDGREAFASAYQWDGTGDVIDYTIPDTVQGARVTAIGGLAGGLKKMPCCGLYVAMPETYRGAERAQYTMPVNAVEVTLPVHIHIGRYVRSVQPDYSLPTPTGYFGYEAGQSCVGDHFAWFMENLFPASYAREAAERGIGPIALIQEKAAKLRAGESGLLALDWWNGNRSCLADMRLSGMLLGMTLQTRPEEIYRALMEGLGFGLRCIIDAHERAGVPIVLLSAKLAAEELMRDDRL